MIASHELNFFKLIFKRLYVVPCLYKLTSYRILFLFIIVAITLAVAMAYYLFGQGCRRQYINQFAWLLLQSLFALIAAVQLRCDNFCL